MKMVIIPQGDKIRRGPGASLRHLRELAGLSRRELAKGMGFRGGQGRRLVARVEAGVVVASPSWFGAAATVCADALVTRRQEPGAA